MNDSSRRAAGRLAAAAIVTYQLLLVAAVVARPDIDVTHKPVSEYAIGRPGWIAVAAFLACALSYAALAAAVPGRTARVLLVICAAGTAGVGVFVADPVSTPLDRLSTIGTLHVIAGLSALLLLPFAALFAGGRRRWLPLAGLLGHYALSVVIPPEGWPPRLLFLTYAIWVVLTAQHIVQQLRPTVPPRQQRAT
ncbi:DUF998 domain-containing protein [Dactylosporangium matsuzakiense]|uniref:DUF998 domain-containing protein n=1 Tax=Dactylosporangium matsuzakiense TaxID=53360 RepID=UPI0021C2AA1B|nr:DUF998 domain-containing protein [Dactylosporangium matsuzakiense]UWZ47776.1 DUF998 domain-containing protein [Dactylosporangium matsuzakiense]